MAMTMKQKIIGLVLILMVAGAAIGYHLYQKPTPDASSYSTDYAVTATDLFAAYEDDEVAANDRYLGKTLQCTGEIREVVTNENGGTTTISLEAGGLLGGISCELVAGQSAEGLKPGQKITIKGICSGLLMDVVLNRCVIDNA